jgi:CelD/BcsL family acetyltransferase involved in cellulose biosynthesis
VDSLQVREWTDDDWAARESQWNGLLATSGLDPLFLSWNWMRLWWQFFGGRPGDALCLLAAYRGETLVGLAPLYSAKVRRNLLPHRSLQFIGISWRNTNALISEYLDVISAPGDRDAVRALFLRHLLSHDSWSELIVSYTPAPEAWKNAFRESIGHRSFYARDVSQSVSHQADLGSGFQQYLSRLGESTRRSLWHLRRRLRSQGRVRLEQVSAEQVASGFQDLNRLHALRWRQPAFGGKRLGFHEALARRLAERDELRLSRLWVGDRVVSVLYDIRKAHRQYNLKLGFDSSIERSFSLGLIHFGFAMESACDEGTTTYDFLAGRGRKTDYKNHLGQAREDLVTVQILKGPVLPRLYRWHDRRKPPRSTQEDI